MLMEKVDYINGFKKLIWKIDAGGWLRRLDKLGNR